MEESARKPDAAVPEQSHVVLKDATILEALSAVLRPRPTVLKVITVRARVRSAALMARICVA